MIPMAVKDAGECAVKTSITARQDGPRTAITKGLRYSTTVTTDTDLNISRKIPVIAVSSYGSALHPKVLLVTALNHITPSVERSSVSQ